MTLTEREVAEMVFAARAGDRAALGDVLEAFRHYLLAVARRELDLVLSAKAGASDLVQETFLEAQRDFARFAGMTEADVQAWLRRLLLNNLSNFHRRYRKSAKRSVRREIDLARTADPADLLEAPTSADEAEDREQGEVLRGLIARLPDEQRTVLGLWFDGRPFDEIGTAIGKSAGAARMTWARAVERLKLDWPKDP